METHLLFWKDFNESKKEKKSLEEQIKNPQIKLDDKTSRNIWEGTSSFYCTFTVVFPFLVFAS